MKECVKVEIVTAPQQPAHTPNHAPPPILLLRPPQPTLSPLSRPFRSIYLFPFSFVFFPSSSSSKMSSAVSSTVVSVTETSGSSSSLTAPSRTFGQPLTSTQSPPIPPGGGNAASNGNGGGGNSFPGSSASNLYCAYAQMYFFISKTMN